MGVDETLATLALPTRDAAERLGLLGQGEPLTNLSENTRFALLSAQMGAQLLAQSGGNQNRNLDLERFDISGVFPDGFNNTENLRVVLEAKGWLKDATEMSGPAVPEMVRKRSEFLIETAHTVLGDELGCAPAANKIRFLGALFNNGVRPTEPQPEPPPRQMQVALRQDRSR